MVDSRKALCKESLHRTKYHTSRRRIPLSPMGRCNKEYLLILTTSHQHWTSLPYRSQLSSKLYSRYRITCSMAWGLYAWLPFYANKIRPIKSVSLFMMLFSLKISYSPLSCGTSRLPRITPLPRQAAFSTRTLKRVWWCLDGQVPLAEWFQQRIFINFTLRQQKS